MSATHIQPEDGSQPRGPLSSVTVVDLTSMVSGPLATSILADQGADVIKVESPGTGDLIRHIGCARGGMSAIFSTINRNKRSVVLDLSRPRGRELLTQLVARADVFVQNFRPGVAERMGIGAEALRAVRPDLVYVSISGFGQSGPLAAHRVYDIVIQALSGMAASQADLTTGKPAPVRNIVCDKVSAIHAAQAITAALFARERSGKGQHVRLSMLDAAIAFLWPDVMQGDTYLGEGVSAQAPLHGILGSYPTTDGCVTVLAISDDEFAGLARALGRSELTSDPRFATVAERMQRSDEIGTLIGEYARSRSTRDVCEHLAAESVPCAPILEPGEVHRHEQVVVNRTLVEVESASSGWMRIPAPVARFDGTPATVRTTAPRLGEHTAQVLAGLGIDAAEIQALSTQGVVACCEPAAC